jgi:hypothetical protein
MSREYSEKAAGEGLLPDFLPQENVTGDILKGRGPRRGNLERLLRYWRPIMKKPGGFTRCRVILANHPEMYPLERICAWLHHETTGLWPNEGCHHPGMKNCKGKLKKLMTTDKAFRKKLNNLDNVRIPGGKGKKSAMVDDDMDEFYSMHDHTKIGEDNPVVTEEDMLHAMKVLSDFVEMEKGFAEYLRDEKNWEIEGEDLNGYTKTLPFSSVERKSDCCG